MANPPCKLPIWTKTPHPMTEDFAHYLQACQQRVARALQHSLPLATEPAARLKSAMAYSVQNGGKRVRATLVYASAEALGCCPDENSCPNNLALDQAACAVEFIHAYSLIHDDLPAMDNDTLRRGKPTCHIAYDEATAILAGDALQTLAFSTLAAMNDLDAATRLALVSTLAEASGHQGMVGGQMLDLAGENCQLDLSALEQIHRYKTGALIRASVQLGALITRYRKTQAGADIPDQALAKLDDYAAAIGLAFQVTDDILDVEGHTATLGKTSGVDQLLHKSTYPALLGLPAAKQKARDLHSRALAALSDFGPAADPLRQLSTFIIQRDR